MRLSEAALFRGMPVVTSLFLTEAGEPIEVRRTWRERFLSRPWRPWKRTKAVIPQVPRRDALVMGGQILVHPAMLSELRRIAGQA